MVLLGYFLNAIGILLDTILTCFIFLFVARAILSWVSPDPNNMIVQFINGTTDPILNRLRGKIPPIGMFDMTIFIVILGLYFIDLFLVRSIMHYAQMMLSSGGPTTVGF